MKWNRLDIQIDNDKFWDDYYLIRIDGKNKRNEYFDADDFLTWLFLTNDIFYCPVLSIYYYRYNRENYVWGLVDKKEAERTQFLKKTREVTAEKFTIESIPFQIKFDSIIADDTVQKSIIAQLLINYLEKDAMWSNTSGKCLVNITTEIKGVKPKKNLVFLEFKIDSRLFLHMNVRTYTVTSEINDKKKKTKLPPYIIDMDRDGRFRRAFREFDDINDDNTYRLYAPRNSKRIFPFFTFTSNGCKLKYLYQLMKRLNNSVFSQKGIVKFAFEEIKGEIISFKNKSASDLVIDNSLLTEFQIWCDVECDGIKKLFDECINNIDIPIQKFKIVYQKSKLKFDIPTLAIIHNEDYYEEKKIDDAYKDSLPVNYPYIQHIQYETLLDENIRDHVIRRSLNELSLKMCISTNKIPATFKSGFRFPEISFCLPTIRKLTIKKEDKEQDIKEVEFPIATLHSNGDICFRMADIYTKEGMRILSRYKYYAEEGSLWKGIGVPSCFFWRNNNFEEIYAIMELGDIFKMPDYERLVYFKTLDERKKEMIDKQIIIDMLEIFFEDICLPLQERYTYIDYINNLNGDRVSLKDAIGKINRNRNLVASFFYWRADPKNPYHNMPVATPWRNEKVFPFFDLPLQMGYTNTEIDLKNDYSKECILYYAGYRSNLNITSSKGIRACIFRGLLSEDTDDYSIWNSIYPLMDTDFITVSNAFSVLPFPVKLLREYVAMKDKEMAEGKSYQTVFEFGDSSLW